MNVIIETREENLYNQILTYSLFFFKIIKKAIYLPVYFHSIILFYTVNQCTHLWLLVSSRTGFLYNDEDIDQVFIFSRLIALNI